MSIPINVAVEDPLSEAVLKRLLQHVGRGYELGAVYGRSGNGYLRTRMSGWNHAARRCPFLLLTDLDNADCAPGLVNLWLPAPKHPNLLFRVAVREVESWLLADRENFAAFLSCSADRIPHNPDSLPDPKKALIALARRSRSREIRSRLVPRSGSTAIQGPDYNACLGEFVARGWDADVAGLRSESLARTLARLRNFQPAQ